MLKDKKIYSNTMKFFLVIILLGTVLLKLPICNKSPISWIDALYESASGVSTTGTTIFNVSEHFTFVGQVVLLLLVQARCDWIYGVFCDIIYES